MVFLRFFISSFSFTSCISPFTSFCRFRQVANKWGRPKVLSIPARCLVVVLSLASRCVFRCGYGSKQPLQPPARSRESGLGVFSAVRRGFCADGQTVESYALARLGKKKRSPGKKRRKARKESTVNGVKGVEKRGKRVKGTAIETALPPLKQVKADVFEVSVSEDLQN